MRTKQYSDDDIFQKESSKVDFVLNSHIFDKEAGLVSKVLDEKTWGHEFGPTAHK